MPGIAGGLKKILYSTALAAGAGLLFAMPTSAQSTIKAKLCAISTVTISQPPRDGTVNNPLVHFSGSVSNAGQIEVYVDNMYNTQIPLPTGATSYSSDITIDSGTHTIKLVAIGNCTDVQNGEASLVVTYVPAKSSGSTSTNISEDGVKVGSTTDNPQQQSPLSPSLSNTLQSIGQWFNFKVDGQRESESRLSVARAMTLASGLALLVFGMATVVIDWVAASTSGFLLPTLLGKSRITIFRVAFRVVGLAIVVLALFV